MKDLFAETKTISSLHKAWLKIKSNGLSSPIHQTRELIRQFDRDQNLNLSRLQTLIRTRKFKFLPQQGVLTSKKSGGVRGIVLAPIQNRIVERALLDCMQANVPFVNEVQSTSSSVGGVPDRSVPHGLAIIETAIKNKKLTFVRSDISGFFDGIPRLKVIAKLKEYIANQDFLNLLEEATLVTLNNEHSLGENRKAFPTYDNGVAQGSPLSGLFGNILLHEFDKKFNDRGMVCVRFVDDFVILGRGSTNVEKAFLSAKLFLKNLGLSCHDPFTGKASKEKAQYGNVSEGFDFLGYNIHPGLLQPSKKARKDLMLKIKTQITFGMTNIDRAIRQQGKYQTSQRYYQTLTLIDRILIGWSDAFSYGNNKNLLQDIDVEINKLLLEFSNWHKDKVLNRGMKSIRRSSGVCLLEDTKLKKLQDLPFRPNVSIRKRATKNSIVVSTDGSLLKLNRFDDSSTGSGGWAAVFHDKKNQLYGYQNNVTNNQMELMAINEALKHTPIHSRVHIRTDSKYVKNTAIENHVVRANFAMWKVFVELCKDRKVSIEWIKGHSGDEFNEMADQIAREQAELAKKDNERVIVR